MDKFIDSLNTVEQYRFENVVRESLIGYLQREKRMLPYYEEKLRKAKDSDSVCMYFHAFHGASENIRLIENYLSCC